MKYPVYIVTLLFFIGSSCSKVERATHFELLSASRTGIDFKNTLHNKPELNILNYLYYYNGAGVVAADFNNDGLVDLFFVGNESEPQLYLNQGNFKFKNTTQASQILPTQGWNTGATHVDINDDGLPDIYVCQASGYRNLKGRNRLYVHQGLDQEGNPYFKEEAETYGLAFEGLSTQAVFFDHDLDGDLDMFLLNHSVHPNRTYGQGHLRKSFDPISGDRFYVNEGGTYVDRSAEVGIFQGKSGYGLGVTVADINNDGYPDLYVGNDFYENDYLYMNQGNGTFKEVISIDDQRLGHTTHFSMGNALADINNDGLVDILSLDMLPEDLYTYKTSGPEYPYPVYRQYLKQGFAPQYMQNTLHLNLDGEHFSEIAHLIGIAATEWSWGALIADWDNDGHKDIFISNGIKGATNDMDFMNYIANASIQRRIEAGMKESDMPLVAELPEKKVDNYFFRNNGDLSFADVSQLWKRPMPSFSNGTTYADLDNDGDLDLIVNNINDHPFILKNNRGTNNNHLTLSLVGPPKNRNGIGTKIKLYHNGTLQVREHFNAQGYLSATDHRLHFGMGQDSLIDSLVVQWPSGKSQTLYNVQANRTMVLEAANALGETNHATPVLSPPLLVALEALSNFKHEEAISLDFDREPLVPFAYSNTGPSIAIGDLNGDLLDDLFITGSKNQASALFYQTATGGFTQAEAALFEKHKRNEDVASLFFDADNDGRLDLLVASGGNEFTTGTPLQPRLYLNKKEGLVLHQEQFKKLAVNASALQHIDFDQDGDQDIIMTANSVPTQFGHTPKQYIFQNDGSGGFKDVTDQIAPSFRMLGNVTDVAVADLNQDGLPDFVAVGHWLPVSIFLNKGGHFELQKNNGLAHTSGWWNTIEIADMDDDGDLDLVCGNWGLNSKFKATKERPVTLFRADFDENGTIDPVVTYYHKDVQTPFASKDELAKQLPMLNKKFLTYQSFARASISDIFGESALKKAEKKTVDLLASTYFENLGSGTFKRHQLPPIAQVSSIHGILLQDLNADGHKDMLLVGNDHEISTQLGRLDANHGVFLQNDGNNHFKWVKEGIPDISGASRTIERMDIKGVEHFVIGRNNNTPVVLKLLKKNK
jgi:enediyne biosynthesis protein E4